MKPFPRDITIGNKYDPAMRMTEQADADEYFAACVEHAMGLGLGREKAEQVERENLGYHAGYFDNETRARVESLFHCKHPFFGSIAENGPVSAEEALRIGVMQGQALREKKP